MKFYCKVCGKTEAKLKVWLQQGGHGRMDEWARVKCPCGTRGPKVLQWGNDFKAEAAAKWVALHGVKP